MDTQSDPHQYTRHAWEANAEVWDVRMGDEGNDFFKKGSRPKQRLGNAPSASRPLHYPDDLSGRCDGRFLLMHLTVPVSN
jgi:hypothetical protein